jgi:Flagellar motor protein
MAKKHKCPEEASERWAIPYADFLTLLLALFIALYAIMRGSKAIPIYAEAFTKAMGMRILPFEQTLPTQILPEPVLPRVQLTKKGHI